MGLAHKQPMFLLSSEPIYTGWHLRVLAIEQTHVSQFLPSLSTARKQVISVLNKANIPASSSASLRLAH